MTKKILSAVVVLAMAMSLAGCGSKSKTTNSFTRGEAEYTYNSYIGSSSVQTLNPHEWEYDSESEIQYFTQMGFYDLIYSSDDESKYETSCEMATELPEDVTKDYAGNETYGVPADATEGYAYTLKLREEACWDDGTKITADDYIYSMQQLLDPDMACYRASTYTEGTYALANAEAYAAGEDKDFDKVGLIKNDDYSITLVFTKQMPSEYMLEVGLSSTWLVKKDLYEANKKDTGGVTKTTYGTSLDTYSSYGPYKLTAWQADKVITLETNDKWWGYTDSTYDGQYQTTKINYQVIDSHTTAFQLFLQGNLDTVSLNADDLTKYGTSDYSLYTPTTYTYKLSFNTSKKALAARESKGVNKTIMTYKDFRKAFSLMLDRSEYISSVAPSSTEAYGLFNDQYIYDSETCELYRDSDQAKEALKTVYDSDSDDISGYNVEEAAELFQSAYDAAVKAGDMKAGDKVKIEFNCDDATNATTTKTINFLNDALEDATKGTKLEGKVKVEAKEADDYYENMANGTADLIFSAWGGDSFDPYGMSQCYCDPDYYSDSENGFDSEQEFTATIDGKDYTYSFYNWYYELCQGQWATADDDVRLQVLAAIEENILTQYCTLPLYSWQQATLTSQKCHYVTDEYSVFTSESYGGMRFMIYDYTDEEWDAYCKDQNNQLTY